MPKLARNFYTNSCILEWPFASYFRRAMVSGSHTSSLLSYVSIDSSIARMFDFLFIKLLVFYRSRIICFSFSSISSYFSSTTWSFCMFCSCFIYRLWLIRRRPSFTHSAVDFFSISGIKRPFLKKCQSRICLLIISSWVASFKFKRLSLELWSSLSFSSRA